jgi:hypothetical protein
VLKERVDDVARGKERGRLRVGEEFRHGRGSNFARLVQMTVKHSARKLVQGQWKAPEDHPG